MTLIHRRSLEISTLVGGFTLGSLVALTSGCSSPAAAAAPEREAAPIHVTTVVAEARPVPRTIALTGSLFAEREADVAAEAAGRVLAVLADRGDQVQAGAPLARLDSRSAVLARAEAGATAAGLVAQKQSAELDCARAERLFATNVISRAEYDRTTASCTTSTQSAAAALARESLAEKALGDAVVRAPFRGVIAERSIEVGDFVSHGKTAFSVVDTRTLKLQMSVPESAVHAVATGHAVTFEVAAYVGREFSGVVRRVAPSLRAETRDELVEVAVDNADGALRPGMFATARLAVGEDRLPVVPPEAVTGRAPAEHVFVVRADSRIEERAIATGERVGPSIAVLRGIAAGERVVVRPDRAVRDGAKVE